MTAESIFLHAYNSQVMNDEIGFYIARLHLIELNIRNEKCHTISVNATFVE